jgi:hypothetical protein
MVAQLQCRKSHPPPNVLPAVTQEGKNIVGFMVDGEVWRNYYPCSDFIQLNKCEELQVKIFRRDTSIQLPISFNLTATRELKPGASFSMLEMEATINQPGQITGYSFSVSYTRDSLTYMQNPQFDFSVLNITKLDTVNQIISGTFNTTLYDLKGDSVVITDGRFDVMYNACVCHY